MFQTVVEPAQPLYLSGSKGNLFAIFHSPQTMLAQGKGVIFIPPFAEEMNKSRRMFALQARLLAKSGIAALIIDLYGTGDSQGDFKDGRWNIWKNDIRKAAEWLRDKGVGHLSLLGLRLGSLLALDVARELPEFFERIVLWHPVTNGEIMLTQFLRLRFAASMMDSSSEKESTKSLRLALTEGQVIEVAGYDIAPELANAIDALHINSFAPSRLPTLHWLEVVASKERPLTPTSRLAIDNFQKNKNHVNSIPIVGEPFWLTPEISLVPELLEITTQLFLR